MKLGSLFDGIGGFPYVAQMCGITPVWASEVEPFPIAVTNHHFPNMKHLGDITKINGAEIEPVDIITFGSPCQDLSIAGQRKGMKHENHGDDETTRSGLFMEAIRIIKEMREKTNGIYPTFAVWENVPGAFSSNKGEDFRTVIEEFCKIKDGNTIIPKPPKNKWARAGAVLGNGYSVAWRTLDAQYWGVPQRRKRIYLVADFGGERAGEILFKSESLFRDIEQSEKERERVARPIEGGVGKASRFDSYNQEVYLETSQTLKAGQGGDSVAKVVLQDKQQPTYCLQGNCIDRSDTAGCNGKGWAEDVCYTLNTIDRPAVTTFPDKASTLRANAGMPKHEADFVGRLVCDVLCFNEGQITSPTNGNNPKPNDPCHTLSATDGRAPTVIISQQPMKTAGCNGHKSTSADITYQEELSPTLERNMPSNVVDERPICMNERQHALTVSKNLANTLTNTDYKRTQLVFEPRSPDEGPRVHENISPTLNTAQGGQRQPCVVENNVGYEQRAYDEYLDTGIGATLKSAGGSLGGGSETVAYCVNESQLNQSVRRLTPTECARLQGYPDYWHVLPKVKELSKEKLELLTQAYILNRHIKTNKPLDEINKPTEKSLINWYNKLDSDSAVYKAYGNSLALPCAYTVIAGISKYRK